MVVVGGGIAGVATAYELASSRSVCLIEAEATPGRHATGRSAGTLAFGYGPRPVGAVTRLGYRFLSDPPDEFCRPLLRARPIVWYADAADAGRLQPRFASILASTPEARRLGPDDLATLCPMLRPESAALAVVDDSACDIDVDLLHGGYMRGLRRRGGVVCTTWQLVDAASHSGGWRLRSAPGESIDTDTVVNAAGAWAAGVGELAGAGSLSLRVQRRTAFVSPSSRWPAQPDYAMVASIAGKFYVKPESGAWLCSPIDKAAHPPGDPRPDRDDIARAIEDINTDTELALRSVSSAWAGLQSFAPDDLPVVGQTRPGFFWLAGLGGFGIQTTPVLARLAAHLVTDTPLADDLAAGGLTPDTFSPKRLETSA